MIALNKVNLFLFDFDGVMTNNLVYVDQDGKESVSCNRSDGIAIAALRKLNKKVYIISTEKNSVVKKRAEKLKVKVLYGVKDKVNSIIKISKKENISLRETIFIGNDINDIGAIKECYYSACPSDSHQLVKKISKIQLKSKGGDGVIRELVEKIFKLDLQTILYSDNPK